MIQLRPRVIRRSDRHLSRDQVRRTVQPGAWLAVLLFAFADCFSAELFDLARPALGIPWGASPSAVSGRFPGLAPDGRMRTHLYQGALRVGTVDFQKQLVFVRFDESGGLFELSSLVPSENAIKIIRHIQSGLGEGRTASYPDGRIFERLYEWTGKDFAIELRYSALSDDALGDPHRNSKARIAIRRQLTKPSELDKALDYPKLAEAVRQQLLMAIKKDARERAAKKQAEIAEKPRSPCELEDAAQKNSHSHTERNSALSRANVNVRSGRMSGLVARLASEYAQVSDPLYALEINEEECAVAIGHQSGAAELWHGCTAPQRIDLNKHYSAAAYFTFTPSGQRLITSAQSSEVATIWDVRQHKELAVVGEVVGRAAVTPDERYAIMETRSEGTRLFDLHANRLIGKPWTVGQSATAIAASGGDIVAVGTASGNIHILRLYRKDPPMLCLQGTIDTYGKSGEAEWVQALAFNSDGGLVSVSRYGRVNVWDTGTRVAIASSRLKLPFVWRARILPQSVIASGSADGFSEPRIEIRSLSSHSSRTARAGSNIADAAPLANMGLLIVAEGSRLRMLPYGALTTEQ